MITPFAVRAGTAEETRESYTTSKWVAGASVRADLLRDRNTTGGDQDGVDV